MSNELNITSGEAAGNIAETSTGENTGVISDNKIVPIANKTNAVEPAADPIPSAADAGASVPAQAAPPVIQAPVPDVQTSAVPAQPITGRQRLRRQQRPRHLRLHPKPLLNLWHRAKHRSLKLPQNVFPVLLRTEKTGKILLISTRTTDLRSVSSVPVTRKNLEIS